MRVDSNKSSLFSCAFSQRNVPKNQNPQVVTKYLKFLEGCAASNVYTKTT